MNNHTAQAILYTEKLSKTYRTGKVQTQALDGLSLSVQQGEIFGYLGPNGAGKTTTIKLLLDLIRPSAGRASVFGLDSQRDGLAIRARIGYIPGELNLWKNKSAQSIIQHFAEVRGHASALLKEARRLADELSLDTSKKMRDYSTGNKRKLGLVLAMMHQPELLILDEPTSGLDPLMQQTFNHMMLAIKAQGRTVFLSSHVLSEVQAICDRVAILRDGQLKAVESMDKLMHVGYRQVNLRLREPAPLSWTESLKPLAQDIQIQGREVHLKLVGDFDPLLRAVSSAYIEDVSVSEPSLEDIFLSFYSSPSSNGTANGQGASTRQSR